LSPNICVKKVEYVMNFIPILNLGPVAKRTLATAVMGLIGITPGPAQIIATQDAIGSKQFIQTSKDLRVIQAVERVQAPGFQTATPNYYQPITWYKSKHWWKKHAPIVGGAAGGALIGGLAGGGAGAVIGGAAGGGGGYLYKRHHDRHHH
jgi:hypothetical protein